MKKIIGLIHELIVRYQNWKWSKEADRLIAKLDKEIPIEIDE